MKRLVILCVWILSIDVLCAAANNPKDPITEIVTLSQKPGECFFDPPSHWWIVDPKVLPSNVKILVKAPEANKYPPCANLAIDTVNCDLATYLKRIKALNDAEGLIWKDLGNIDTKAGKASLSQVDTETNWGTVRMMHAIFIHKKQAHILTCAALKSEFPKHYSTFFEMMQSLRVNPSLFEKIADPARKQELETAYINLKKEYQALRSQAPDKQDKLAPLALFETEEFQSKYWKNFCATIHTDFADMDTAWQDAIISELKNELSSLE